MKKIVAIVLSLVMVLGLATTAFGATAASTLDNALDTKHASQLWDVTITPEDDADEKDQTFATYTVQAVALKDGAVAWWDTSITGVEKGDDEDIEIKGEDEFVIVASAALADLVVVNGKTITYLAVAEKYNEDGWDEVATKVTLPVLPDAEADLECCTNYAWSTASATFYEFNDTLYRAKNAKIDTDPNFTFVFNVDGVVVEVVKAKVLDATRIDGDVKMAYDNLKKLSTEGDYVYSAHNYVVEAKSDSYGNGDVTKVYCDLCKNEFKFVEAPVVSAAVAVFGAGNYFELADNLYLAIDETSGATAATETPAVDAETAETVESAKTFDAGVAMYVGMSVMAAAGSAVVLKKKD